jgi:arylformamidase
MHRIDIGGVLRHHMWEGVSLYPLVEVYELPPRGGRDNLSYSQAIYTPVQTSSYLETAAHLYPERIKVADLPLDRLFTEAVVLQIPLGPKQAITSAAIQQALAACGEALRPGDSLLISTGWDAQWDAPNFISESPYFAAEAIDWILAQKIGLLGSDASQWDNGKQGFFPRYFQTEMLLLGPLVKLNTITHARARLITLPLKVMGTCAAPCRVIVEE